MEGLNSLPCWWPCSCFRNLCGSASKCQSQSHHYQGRTCLGRCNEWARAQSPQEIQTCSLSGLEAGSPAQGPAGSRPIRLPSGLCSFRRLQVTVCVLACFLHVPRLGVPFLPLQGRTQQVVSFSRPLPLTSCCPSLFHGKGPLWL